MRDGGTPQQTTTTMLGRYQLLRRIGKGGMGDVWLGDDPRLHRQVAIKILPTHNQQDREYTLRFEREARAAAALNHPHILPIHDYGEQPLPNGQVITYLVMPYISGGSLADRIAASIASRSLISPYEAITYLSQAAEAIDYAHSQGIVHRDIKPANMLLRADNWLMLTDFGIARMLSNTEHLTQTGVGIGTPEYMAPEQAQGKAEAASDLYSLAVLAYYLFTGQLPFHAETSYATTIQHMTLPPPPPRQVNPALSPAFETILLQGLAKQPAQRPASARVFIGELQRATSSAPFEVTYAAGHTPLPNKATFSDKSTSATFIRDAQTTLQEAPGRASRQIQATPISRRQMLIGGGAALVVIGGGIGTWAIVSSLNKPKPTLINKQVTHAPAPNANGPALILQGHVKPATAIAWSPRQNILASVADNDYVLLWDLQQQRSGTPTPTAKQYLNYGSSMQLAWSPDAKFLAVANTGSSDLNNQGQNVSLFKGDLSNLAPGFASSINTTKTFSIVGMGWTRQTTLVMISSRSSFTDTDHFDLWATDVTKPQLQLQAAITPGTLGGSIGNHIPLLAVSPDGTKIALTLYDNVAVGQVTLTGNVPQWEQQAGGMKFDNPSWANPMGVAWLSNGRTIGSFYASNFSTLSFWNWQGGKKTPVKTLQTQDNLTVMACSPVAGSSLIATATKDGKVLIWNLNKGTAPVATLDGGDIQKEIAALAWSADGYWLAASYKDTNASILVWKIQGRGF